MIQAAHPIQKVANLWLTFELAPGGGGVLELVKRAVNKLAKLFGVRELVKLGGLELFGVRELVELFGVRELAELFGAREMVVLAVGICGLAFFAGSTVPPGAAAIFAPGSVAWAERRSNHAPFFGVSSAPLAHSALFCAPRLLTEPDSGGGPVRGAVGVAPFSAVPVLCTTRFTANYGLSLDRSMFFSVWNAPAQCPPG